ncbi:MAG: hypothetical protein H7175_26720 [Burkholderiales bacterium]|nr:hypothetical protein [Anaerolineae bacterium]
MREIPNRIFTHKLIVYPQRMCFLAHQPGKALATSRSRCTSRIASPGKPHGLNFLPIWKAGSIAVAYIRQSAAPALNALNYGFFWTTILSTHRGKAQQLAYRFEWLGKKDLKRSS